MSREILVVANTCLLLIMGLMTLTAAIPIRGINTRDVQANRLQETPLIRKPVCPPLTNFSSISMDIGCKADFNDTVLRKLKTLIMKCHPVVEDATCEWSYNNIPLTNTSENTVPNPGNHKFKVIASPVTSLKIDIGLYTYLPRNTINCTCSSPNKSESRFTYITSKDFPDFNY